MSHPRSEPTSGITGFVARQQRWAAMGVQGLRFLYPLRTRPVRDGELLLRFPLKRHWVAILVVALILVPFSLPLVSVAGQVDFGSGELFEVTGSLFSIFWLLGWSVGVLMLAVVLLGLLFGSEVLHARPGYVTLWLQVFRLGLGIEVPWSQISHLRACPPTAEPGDAWRGPHLALDVAGETITFGSHLDGAAAATALTRITAVASRPSAGQPIEPVTRAVPPIVDTQTPALGSASARALLLANLIPVLGVLAFGWQIGEIFLLYWAESAIIGVYALARMWVVGRWAVLFIGLFFIGHYGGFMAIHLLFIYGLITNFATGPDITMRTVLADFIHLWPALLGLAISHGISFRQNFIGRREYTGTNIGQQMTAPYGRIVVMHLTIILGGMAAMALGTPLAALILMIGLKTVVDLGVHVKQHRKPVPRSAT